MDGGNRTERMKECQLLEKTATKAAGQTTNGIAPDTAIAAEKIAADQQAGEDKNSAIEDEECEGDWLAFVMYGPAFAPRSRRR